MSLSANAISESIEPELTDEMVQAFDVAKPFTYRLVFDLEPTLTWKQPYQGMKVKHHRACQAAHSYIHSFVHSFIHTLIHSADRFLHESLLICHVSAQCVPADSQ